MNASQLLIVRRRHAGNFTQIPNTLIRNPELGSKSLGVIVHLLSLPPGFRISLESLCRARKEGETAMRTAIQQLEKLGYMRIVRERAASGQFIHSRWIVSDEPIVDWAPYLENPAMEEPALDQPDQGDQGTTNTESVEIRKNSNTSTTPYQQPLAAVALPLEISDEGDQECWLWLCEKLSIDPEKTRDDCAGLGASTAIDVLAEIVECKHQGGIRKSIPQFMSSLLRKAREGKFSLSAGAALRKNLLQIIRRQKALEAVVKPTPVETGTEPPMDRAQQRERLRQLREELARKAHTQVIPVGRP